MSEPDQCIICLDLLPRPSEPTQKPVNGGSTSEAGPTTPVPRDDSENLDLVAALDGCEHVIHDACIRSWAQKTNTCPICRNIFHSVRVFNGLDGTAVSSYNVEDKKQVAEFDVQQWLGENPDEDEEEATPCPICESAEREDILLLCDGCDAAYHTHCIGLNEIPAGDWFCMECSHLMGFRFGSRNETEGEAQPPRAPRPSRRPVPRGSRGSHVRTRARLRRAQRQARNVEWQGAWGQFSGRFYEMSELDLDNLDDEDEDLEQFRRFQQLDRQEIDREMQRWQQRMNIARRLGAREAFVNNIPPQISERLQPSTPPVQETPEERRAWSALERARETEESPQSNRKRKARSITASPAEPVQEPERKLKRPRTRRLPTQGEASSRTPPGPGAGSATSPRASNGVNGGNYQRNGVASRATAVVDEPPLVSSLLRELEPNGASDDESLAITAGWRVPIGASSPAHSPAMSPSPSAHSSPRALSLTPPPGAGAYGRPTSPTLSLSTHIEPVYPPANYSPTRETSDSESRNSRVEIRPLELRQPRPRRQRSHPQPRTEDSSPTRITMTQAEKKSINDIVKNALRPHWRAQKLTTEQYATINRDISRKLYDDVKNATTLDEEAKDACEKRAAHEVARAVEELQI